MATCRSCGTENPDGFRLCGMCGAPLGAASERHERRVVSVLFADLVSFTSRAERSDVEDVERFLRRYYETLRGELERHGGSVEKFIGDAVVALFGVPVAHEDDPERAVRAGLAIQEAIARLRDEDGIDLHVRVGITTGEVLVAWPEGGEAPRALGDVVNTAARLQTEAAPDSVIVDESTRDGCQGAVAFDDGSRMAAKGKAEPVAAWTAVAVLSELPGETRTQDLPLVGRGEELVQLMSLVRRSQREPSTQLVTVIGAPGIGKTRLVRELEASVQAASDESRWVRGRSLSYGDAIAYWALGEIVKQLANILESDSGDAVAEKLSRLVTTTVSNVQEADWVLRHVRPLVGIEADSAFEGRQLEAFAAWRRLFEALAQDRPTVLLFEDAHWADDELLDFIEQLGDRAGEVPLLVVCTARPELLERRSGWGGGKTNTTTLTLQPLPEENAAALLVGLLGDHPATDEVKRGLLDQAEGNPLYVQEYVRMLQDRALLVLTDDGWELLAQPEGLPESIHGVIAARLDTASPEEREFIQDAAVVGRVAWLGAVGALSQISRWQADDLLHRLQRRQFLRRHPHSTIEGDVEFSFSHALIRDVAYQQLPRARRAQRHEAAARWIRALERGREDAAELIAHHWVSALRLRAELGEDPAAITHEATAALLAAGDQADLLHSYDAAYRHYRAAEAMSPEAGPAIAEIRYRAAAAAYRANRPDANDALEAAFHALVAAGDSSAAAEVAQFLGEWWYERRDAERGEQWWAKAEPHARKSGNRRVLNHIAEDRMSLLSDQDRYAEALPLADQALEEARIAGDQAGVGLLLRKAGFLRLATGDPSGLSEMHEAIDVLEHLENPYTCWAYIELAQAEGFVLGNIHAGSQAVERAVPWAQRTGEQRLVEDSVIRRAWFAYHAGAWDDARRISDRHLREGFPWGVWIAHWVSALIATAQGTDDDVRRAGAALKQIDPADELEIRALVLHRDGEQDQAAAVAREWVADTARVKKLRGSLLAELIEISGAHDAIRDAAAELHPENSWRRPLLLAVDGCAADAAAAFEQTGSLPLAARAHGLAAAQALRTGDRAEAAVHAERALHFYESVAATRYADQVRSLIRDSSTMRS